MGFIIATAADLGGKLADTITGWFGAEKWDYGVLLPAHRSSLGRRFASFWYWGMDDRIKHWLEHTGQTKGADLDARIREMSTETDNKALAAGLTWNEWKRRELKLDVASSPITNAGGWTAPTGISRYAAGVTPTAGIDIRVPGVPAYRPPLLAGLGISPDTEGIILIVLIIGAGIFLITRR